MWFLKFLFYGELLKNFVRVIKGDKIINYFDWNLPSFLLVYCLFSRAQVIWVKVKWEPLRCSNIFLDCFHYLERERERERARERERESEREREREREKLYSGLYGPCRAARNERTQRTLFPSLELKWMCESRVYITNRRDWPHGNYFHRTKRPLFFAQTIFRTLVTYVMKLSNYLFDL